MDLATPVPGMDLNFPPPSTSSGSEGAILTVDFSQDIVIDKIMSDIEIPPAVVRASEDVLEHEDSGKLSLAYERLYEIPITIVERFADHITYLDLSHNKITNLDALVYFNHLTSLIADSNPITEDCFLPPLPKLGLLWLNNCKISSLYPWVEKLKESCPNLEYLCLMGNPAAPSLVNGSTFYEYLQYRLFVISQFPSLNHLDDRKVTDDQRDEARRLYKRPFFERLIKPGPGGLSQLVHSSVTWNGVQSKLSSLLRRDRPAVADNNRNLLI